MFQRIAKQNSSSSNSSRSSGLSVIGPDVRIVGDIVTQGEMEIDGDVEGDITCQTLMIGEGAKVRGAVHADVVRIHGSLKGKIFATNVSLSKTAEVLGDVTHVTLQIEAGAVLEGHLLQQRSGTAVPQLEDKSTDSADAKTDDKKDAKAEKAKETATA